MSGKSTPEEGGGDGDEEIVMKRFSINDKSWLWGIAPGDPAPPIAHAITFAAINKKVLEDAKHGLTSDSVPSLVSADNSSVDSDSGSDDEDKNKREVERMTEVEKKTEVKKKTELEKEIFENGSLDSTLSTESEHFRSLMESGKHTIGDHVNNVSSSSYASPMELDVEASTATKENNPDALDEKKVRAKRFDYRKNRNAYETRSKVKRNGKK
jgi:hypothetical protein